MFTRLLIITTLALTSFGATINSHVEMSLAGCWISTQNLSDSISCALNNGSTLDGMWDFKESEGYLDAGMNGRSTATARFSFLLSDTYTLVEGSAGYYSFESWISMDTGTDYCTITINGVQGKCYDEFYITPFEEFTLIFDAYGSTQSYGGNGGYLQFYYNLSHVRDIHAGTEFKLINGHYIPENPTEVPEPSTLALTGIALLAILPKTRTNQSQQ